MRIAWRLVIVLSVFTVFPCIVILQLLYEGRYKEAEDALLVCLIISGVLLLPLGRLIGYFVIGKDLKKVNRLFSQVREGRYNGYFVLPPEKEDENELITLKRNMNWMLHAVALREGALHLQLEEQVLSTREFEKMSYIDGLTGVYNRRFFDDNFGRLTLLCQQRGVRIALILIDCDHFKEVNDTYGHQAGDEILVELGGILKEKVRSGIDYPFRYGGDEFGIILQDVINERLLEIAENIRAGFEQKNTFGTTLSIGIANCSCEAGTVIEVKKIRECADSALYAAKKQGKNRVSLSVEIG